jgi:uncharacterized membrane protein SirB2
MSRAVAIDCDCPQYWFVFAPSVTKTMSKLPVQGDSIQISSQPEPPSARDVPLPAGGGLSAHILPTSATMIGVCMTVLTIGHIGSPGDVRWLIDKLLALNALIFLASAVMSFVSLRVRTGRRSLELRAEWIFIFALALLALIAIVIAFEVT